MFNGDIKDNGAVSASFGGEDREKDYIKLDPEATEFLYRDILELFIASTGKTITIQKTIITVGTARDCDLNFGYDNQLLDSHHATFTFDNGKWLLTDNQSYNGTYINGVKLQADKKYMLTADDEIIFAGNTKLIFYKLPLISNKPFVPLVEKLGLLPIGMLINGRYRLEECLSVNKQVYIASVSGENRKVIIKAEVPVPYRGNFFPNNLKDEYELHKGLHHSGIAEMQELIETTLYTYIVREYIEGMTVDRIIRKGGALEMRQTVVYAVQIAEILQYLHSLCPPIICRDVKPSNIIITPDGDARMFDFSIAVKAQGDDYADAYIAGTRGYAPPEQYKGFAKPRSDIYGLGMTMFYMLTDSDPGVLSYEQIQQTLEKFSPDMKRIIGKCIKKNYKNRYSDCGELIRELKNFINSADLLK